MRSDRSVYVFILIAILYAYNIKAQEASDHLPEQAIEQLGESESFVAENDASVQHLQYLLNHPLDINLADQQDLIGLNILSPIQITSFLLYRNLNKFFISVYELQAIPYWDLLTIKKLLPYFSLSDHFQRKVDWKASWREGIRQIVLGTSIKTSQYSNFLGSNERAYIRCKYHYKKSLQYGIAAEKDAGEAWFKGAQQYGFDFYSAHFATANKGKLKMLILGDYVVNMGQGLIIWQSMAFRKSSEVMLIKRQAQIIRPYHSFGEYLFQRGIATTCSYRSWSLTAFLSVRHLDATIRTDSLGLQRSFSSINSSGLHRTNTEIKNKGSLPVFISGSSLKYERIHGHAAINFLHTDFGNTLQHKESQPYNRYAWNGSSYANMSMDWAYTYRNLHVFGEYALHRFRDQAFLGALMMSLDPKADISLLYRNMSPRYQTHFGNAFSESAIPSNEKGLYAGLTIRPAHTWAINMYADIFRFPWLRYAVDAPSAGKEYMIQLSRAIRRQSNFYIRFRFEEKEKNVDFNIKYIREGIVTYKKFNIRAQTELHYNKQWTIRNRVEVVNVRDAIGINQSGFLCFFEALYKPLLRPFAFNMRVQYFESDTYDSRVYAYEQDILYQFAIPSFYGSGYKAYLNGCYKLGKSLMIGFKLSRLWQQKDIIDEFKIQITWNGG